MVYTERYNTFEAGFLKEAADQGMDVAYLEGMIAQATEIQEKWAAAFDELEEITGDNTVKIKIGNDIAQWTLMKYAAETGEPSWYDPANPQMQKLLSHFGGGSQGQQGAIGGGVGGGLLGLILGLMTKNPMLGLMLGGLGGAGFGGLLGSGKFKEWFGNKGATPEAVSQVGLEGNNLNAEQEANGGPASDPAQAPRTTGDTELAAQLQGNQEGASNDFNRDQISRFNQSQKPMERFDSEVAPIEDMANQNQFDQSVTDQNNMEAGHQFADANKHYRNSLRLEQSRLGAEQASMPANAIPEHLRGLQESGGEFLNDVQGAPGRVLDRVNQGLDQGADYLGEKAVQGLNRVQQGVQQGMQRGGQVIQQGAEAAQRGADQVLSGGQQSNRPLPQKPTPPQGLQAPNQTKMFPSAGQAPFRSIANNNPVKFQSPPTQPVATPNVGTPNVSSNGLIKGSSSKLELGTIVKKAHFKLALSGMLSGPSYSGGGSMGNQMQSSVLNMGQPTTSQQAPFLPKGAPIVYPNSSQPRQVNANYAVAPKV